MGLVFYIKMLEQLLREDIDLNDSVQYFLRAQCLYLLQRQQNRDKVRVGAPDNSTVPSWS
jgi:hypothetical protein